MPRLFIGVAVPAAIQQHLSLFQPRPQLGLRLVRPDQIHLTLHFLGERDLESMRCALASLHSPSFSLTLDTLGQFSGRQVTILWAGLRCEPGLMQLYTACADALLPAGYLPEKRPFHPHITLARCDHRVPRPVVESFVQQPLESLSFLVDEVILFSSNLTTNGLRYDREAAWHLQQHSHRSSESRDAGS